MRYSGSPRPARFGLLVLIMVSLLATTVNPAVAHEDPNTQSAAPHGIFDQLRKWVWINKQLRKMSAEEKVGQLFSTYVYGDSADTTNPADVAANQAAHGVDNAQQLIDTYHLGGVIYFTWSNNLKTPVQIAGLSNGMQTTATQDRYGVPLLISTDQEQGIVTRFGPPATAFPGSMALGATGDAQAARTAADITGVELKAVGINQNFAPVADVNVNADNPVIGVRSFSGDPQLAAELTAAQVEGYQGADGVVATAKHFPGHGDTDVDSHLDLPRITHSYQEWQDLDAPPFDAAIDAGIDAIMTGHIRFPALDDTGTPGTLSRPILTGLLRDELGFDGVVITDSLSMEGLRENYSDARIPVEAILAGADMLLMPPDIDLAYNSVLAAVDDGEITPKRLDQSVRRILDLKYDRGIVADPFVDPEAIDTTVGTPEHRAAAAAIAEATTTLIRNDNQTLPLAADTGSVFVTGWGASTTTATAQRITDRGVPAASYWSGTTPTEANIREAVARSAGHEVTVVLTNSAWTNQAQADLVAALVAAGRTVVSVAVGVPYDIAKYPQVDTNLATFSYTAPGLDSLVKVLFGEVNPSGKLPVMIPTADDPQTPLYEFGHGLRY